MIVEKERDAGQEFRELTGAGVGGVQREEGEIPREVLGGTSGARAGSVRLAGGGCGRFPGERRLQRGEALPSRLRWREQRQKRGGGRGEGTEFFSWAFSGDSEGVRVSIVDFLFLSV